MSKSYRPWNLDQAVLLPPSVHEPVPDGHIAQSVRDRVRDSLDLSATVDQQGRERG